MKTIEKDTLASKALLEVWKWKDEVYKDIRNMTFKEKQKYFEDGLKEAEQLLTAKLKKNPDGSYSFI